MKHLKIILAGTALFCAYGYFTNAVKLYPVTSVKETMIRTTGVIIPPVGIVFGYTPKKV